MQERTLNGWAVKALREALALPAGTFAVDCLMSPGQLSSIENGRKPASEDATRRIVTALERAYPTTAAAHHRATPVNLWLALTVPATTTAGAAA